MKKFKTKIINLIISLFIFVFVIELISFSLNKLDNTKLFRIRVFNEITNDERVFTLKKNISHIEKRIETDNKSWELYTSAKGIRVVETTIRPTHTPIVRKASLALEYIAKANTINAVKTPSIGKISNAG